MYPCSYRGKEEGWHTEENNILHSVNFLTIDAEQNLVSFLATQT